jgi:hypothetical protein
MNILAKSGYKPLTRSQILDGKMLKRRATHTSLPLSPRALQNERALPPLAVRNQMLVSLRGGGGELGNLKP